MTQKRRAIPNFFTIGNLIGGILAIVFSLTNRIEWAPYCIFGSILFDFIDGFSARILHAQVELGKQMDSLADMITFGVSPGIMVFVYFKMMKGEMSLGNLDLSPSLLSGSANIFYEYMEYIAFIIPIFALFRLAKFNLDTRQSTSFIGLPTATMALFFAVFPILIKDAIEMPNDFKTWVLANGLLNPIFLTIAVIILSILMLSEIPLFALKINNFKWKGNGIRYLFLILSLTLVIVFLFWAIPLIVILYLLLSIVNNAINPSKVG